MKISRILIILILSLELTAASELMLENIRSTKFDALIEAVRVMVRRALHQRYQMIHIMSAVSDERHVNYQDLMTKFLRMAHESYANRLDTLRNQSKFLFRLRQNSVIFLDKIENFRLYLPGLQPDKYRFSGNFLIILVNGFIGEIEEIFIAMWHKNIYNVYVVYEEANEVPLITFLPFENASRCGDTSAQVITYYRNGKFDNESILFPQKLRNLNQCPIRSATYLDPGCFMRRTLKDGTVEMYGYRYEFMSAIAKSLNYTNDIKIVDGILPWGVITVVNDTVNATGAFHELLENNSDVAFSEYYLKSSRNRFFDNSYPIYVTPMVFVIPPGRLLGPIEKLFQPFHYVVWIALLTVNAIAVVVILIINHKYKRYKSFVYGKNVRHPLTNMYIAMLGSQQLHLPKRNFARFTLMVYLIFCLILRSCYQGAIFKFLQSDGRHKEVQSIDEMLKKDFTFYMFESSFDFVQNQSEIKKRTKFYGNKNFIMENPLYGHEKVAALEALSDVHSANLNNRDRFVHKICNEPLMTISLVLYFRKNFFLRTEIDSKIKALISSGLIDYWIGRSLTGFKGTKSREPTKLNLQELRGPFNILFIGYSAAFLVFLTEMSIRRLNLFCKLLKGLRRMRH